jgi:hypothetical protein
MGEQLAEKVVSKLTNDFIENIRARCQMLPRIPGQDVRLHR